MTLIELSQGASAPDGDNGRMKNPMLDKVRLDIRGELPDDGQIVEEHGQPDLPGLLQQIGAAPI
jgi:hypothetical protein